MSTVSGPLPTEREAEGAARPSVWVIVLTWNRLEAVITCVLSLNALRYPNFHVVVVDNHSEDGTVERLRAAFPRLDLIVNERNLGYTGGNNVGIRHALAHGADYVLLLNNDTAVHPDLVDELVRVAESDPTIAVVGAKNMCWNRPGLVWAAWGEVSYGATLTRVFGWHVPDREHYRMVRDVGHVVGCGYMWRRAALEQIGLLDTNFFGYHEDVDWCHRARRAGWRVVFAGGAIVYHAGSLSARISEEGKPSIPIMYFLGRNGVLFTRKHAGRLRLVQLSFNAAVGSLRRWLRSLRLGGPSGEGDFWRGYWDGLHNRNRQRDFRADA